MTGMQTEESRWAGAVANRLKLLQSSCADDPGEHRRQTLREDLRRMLSEIPSGRRQAHLEALLDRFPVLSDSHAPVQSPPPPPQQPSLLDATPEHLLARLAELMPTLPEDHRRRLEAQMPGASHRAAEQAPGEWAATDALQSALRMEGGQPLDGERIQRLLVLLFEALLVVDQFAWGRWAELAPESSFKRPAASGGDMRLLIRAFLLEQDDAAAQRHWAALKKCFAESSGRTPKLVAEMLVALHRAGLKFGREFINQMSPDLIKDVVGPGGIFGNWKQACWDKYAELFRHYSTPEAVAQKFKEAYVKAVEERLTVRQSAPPS